MKINDGGPMFPHQDWDPKIQSQRREHGCSLRAWLAGTASASVAVGVLCSAEGAELSEQALAKASVRIADAIITELEKETK